MQKTTPEKIDRVEEIGQIGGRLEEQYKKETQQQRDKRIANIKEQPIESTFGIAYANIEKYPEKERSEDRLAIGNGVYVVCDGVGSANHPEIGAQIAAEMMVEVFGKQFRDELPQRSNQQAYVEERGLLFLEQAKWVVGEHSTTLTGIVFWENKEGDNLATVVHTGDSKMYILNNGDIRSLTVDESFARMMLDEAKTASNEEERKNLILAAQNPRFSQVVVNILNPKGKYSINAGGTGNVHTIKVPEGATFVIASDGIEKLHPTPDKEVDPEGFYLGEGIRDIAQQVENKIRREGGAKKDFAKMLGEALFKDATKKGLLDDYSTIVVQTPSNSPSRIPPKPMTKVGATRQPTLEYTAVKTKEIPELEKKKAELTENWNGIRVSTIERQNTIRIVNETLNKIIQLRFEARDEAVPGILDEEELLAGKIESYILEELQQENFAESIGDLQKPLDELQQAPGELRNYLEKTLASIGIVSGNQKDRLPENLQNAGFTRQEGAQILLDDIEKNIGNFGRTFGILLTQSDRLHQDMPDVSLEPKKTRKRMDVLKSLAIIDSLLSQYKRQAPEYIRHQLSQQE